MKNTLISLSVGFELPTESFKIETHQFKILEGIPSSYPDQIETITSDLMMIRLEGGNDLLLFNYVGRYDAEVISQTSASYLINDSKSSIESKIADYLNELGIFYSIYQ